MRPVDADAAQRLDSFGKRIDELTAFIVVLAVEEMQLIESCTRELR
jgi:hypothetical protein